MKNFNKDKRTSGLKRGGSPVLSRTAIYNKLSAHSAKAIKELITCLDSKNENIKLGAVKLLLDKIVPDLNSNELKGENGGQIQLFVNVGSGFVPASLGLRTSPARSLTNGQPPLQSSGLA